MFTDNEGRQLQFSWANYIHVRAERTQIVHQSTSPHGGQIQSLNGEKRDLGLQLGEEPVVAINVISLSFIIG